MLHEVLMTVAQTHPHLFVRNGVTYNCIELMAITLWDYMVKDQKGVINLRVLAHVSDARRPACRNQLLIGTLPEVSEVAGCMP